MILLLLIILVASGAAQTKVDIATQSTGTLPESRVDPNLVRGSELSAYQAVTEKEQNNGYPGLDSGGKLNRSRVPVLVGADSGTSGQAGAAPAPAAGDQGKCLKGDGTWGECDSTEGTMDHSALISRDLADQHPASSIVNNPAGDISSNTVQDAINELDAEKLGIGATAESALRLATDPTPCPSGTYVKAMGADGSLTCDTPAGGGVGLEFINVKNHGAAGDGVADDTAAIQAALNEAAGGGTVFFPAGVYLVRENAIDSFHCLLVRSNTRVTGSGYNSVIKLAPNQDTSVRIFYTEDPFSNVEISHLRVDGNKANQASCNEHKAAFFIRKGADLRLHHLWIHDTCGDAVQLWGDSVAGYADRITVDSVSTWNHERSGVVVEQAKNIRISNSTFRTTATSPNSHCVDYEAQNQPPSGDTWGPITIVNNTCILGLNSQNDGFQLSSSYPARSIVSGNTVKNGRTGVYIGMNMFGSLVKGNVISDASANGIHIRNANGDIVVANNYVSSTGAPGIQCESSMGTPQLVRIEGNSLVGDTASSVDAIRIRGCRNTAVVGNQIRDYKTAIHLYGTIAVSNHVWVKGNLLSNYQTGVYYSEGVTGSPDYILRIEGNAFDGGTWGGAASVHAMEFCAAFDPNGSEPYPFIVGNTFGIHGGSLVYRVGGGLELLAYVDGIFGLNCRRMVSFSTASPEGAVYGSVGDRISTAGGDVYEKVSGYKTNTGWVAQ